jgi:glucosyl-dolichyl phosphate glucuronosyltransferase
MSDRLPSVSVTICTFNRARWLRETLQCITRQDYPAELWEILVIDNNSSDGTAAVVAEFAGAPKVPRYILETNQGSSFARNRGIDEATGNIIVFTDDDMLGPREWLSHLMRPFVESQDARMAAVGGEVVPVFPEGLPGWLAGYWKPLGFRTDIGPLRQNQLPMTANLAIRKVVFAEVGKFRTDLGRIGDHSLFNEDHDFCRRLFAAGYRIWYSPIAALEHQIPASRLTFRYTCRQMSHAARSRVVESVGRGGAGVGWLLSRIFGYTLQLVWCTLLSLLSLLVFQAGVSKRFLARAGRAWGYISEAALALGRLGRGRPGNS